MSLITDSLINELKQLFPSAVHLNVPLSYLSKWKIGGNAKVVVSPNSKQELSSILRWSSINMIPSLVIGSTTNLLFSDNGVNALIIQIGKGLSKLTIENNLIIAEAGVWAPNLARFSLKNKLSGAEHICGIPGTIGGLVYMNGGSQRKGIGSSIVFVETVDKKGYIKRYKQEECDFQYRSSKFHNLDEIIVEVGLMFTVSNSETAIRREMLEILSSRRKKFPKNLPNCGSVFVSDPAMYEDYGPPGKVIESFGFKGMSYNGAQISDKHANFIVNKGNARAEDVIHLINLVHDKVYSETGYSMGVEVRFVNEDGKLTKLC